MSRVMKHPTVIAVVAAGTLMLPSLPAAERTWTNAGGAEIRAELKRYDPGSGNVGLLKGGTLYEIPLDTLSPADRAYVDTWVANGGQDEAPKPKEDAPVGTMNVFPLDVRAFERPTDYFSTTWSKNLAKSEGKSPSEMAELIGYLPGGESAHLRVPAGYPHDPGDRYGLVVWHSQGAVAQLVSDAYLAPFSDRKLILISPHNTANDTTPLARRMALALDCIASVGARYHVDERRVYLMGHSYGGLSAMLAALAYPESVRGAMCSAMDLVIEPENGIPARYLWRDFSKSNLRRRAESYPSHRYVFLSPEENPLQSAIAETARQWREVGFVATTMEDPVFAFGYIDAELNAQALELLDPGGGAGP